MSADIEADLATEGLEDLVERLGGIPLKRIRLYRLGEATEADLIAYQERRGRLCELVDGVIVEKPLGYFESRLAFVLGGFLDRYLEVNDLGIALGADGMVRVEGQVREPDVSFFAWSRFPGRLLPRGAILRLTPDLAVEVLSPGNTRREMERKRREYFLGGCSRVWEVDPEAIRVRVYTDPLTYTELGEDDTLTGDPVLPGFALSIRRWFERAGQREQGGTAEGPGA